MALTLYYRPFSSYSWKVLIPLCEAGTPFAPRRLDDPQIAAEWKRRSPIAQRRRRSSNADRVHPIGKTWSMCGSWS